MSSSIEEVGIPNLFWFELKPKFPVCFCFCFCFFFFNKNLSFHSVSDFQKIRRCTKNPDFSTKASSQSRFQEHSKHWHPLWGRGVHNLPGIAQWAIPFEIHTPPVEDFGIPTKISVLGHSRSKQFSKNYVKKVWKILEFQPKSTVKTFQIQPKFMKKVLKNSKSWQFAVNL